MALPDTSENRILERIVRIEESLAHYIELTRQGFLEMNKRFELLLYQTNRRFEQIDKRFEAMQIQIDRRFEQVDRRFEQIDKRFDQVDGRFDALTRRMDRFMVWPFSTTLAVGGIVIGVLKVWL